ncbi:MAG: LamG-like jellyroll fold domain-containing protein [Sediminibacterium sp.]
MRFFTRKVCQLSIFTLLILSTAITTFGQVTAGALSFDGVNDKVLVKRSTTSGGVNIGDPSFNITDVITIEAWLNPESGGGSNVQTVLSKSQRFPVSAQNGYIFPRTNDNWNNIAFLLNFNGMGWKQLTAPYPGKDSWHHVAATYDGAFMRIYIDGVMMNEMAVTGTITVNTNPVTIGYQNGYTNEFYRGKIDELRVWNRALSVCEIATNKGCELKDENKLVAYYKFNQGLPGGVSNILETKLKDKSIYKNDGELIDFGLLSNTSNWIEGIVNGTCANFVPPVVTIGSNSLSVGLGGTLELSAGGGVSYSWTGPNGFTSNQQNPVINNITANAAGLYTVTVTTASGCSVPASINIQVSNPARALNFDGLNDFVSIPHHASLNPATGLTVEGWIYPTDGISPSQSVIGKSTNQVQGYIFPRTDDGWKSFSFYVHLEGQGWSIISAAYPSINEWHHVAATYDGFTMKIYLDGELKATKAITGIISSNQNPITIGAQPGFSGEFFKGNVDEIRIWNRPLEECEIDNNRSCQLNPAIQNGLAAYYRFNQGLAGVNNITTTTVSDISGNINNGTLTNFTLTGSSSNWVAGNVNDVVCNQFVPIAATASVNGPILEVGNTVQLTASGGTSYSWTGPNNFTSNQQNPSIPNAQTVHSGVYTVSVSNGGCTSNINTKITVAFKAGSLDFDGVNDLVTVPANNSLNITDNITMEAWIYPTDGTNMIQNVMGKSTAGDNNGYIFPRTDDGWKTISFFLHLNGQWKVLTAQYPGINQWNHVSATYDGFFMRIYINGALVASTEASGKITTNGNNLVLGQQPGFVEYYRGKVEEARIWNRTLNQCEVINNMNCELQAQQTGLVAYYKFNQGFVNAPNTSENVLLDASPNGNNGTLSNFTLDGLTSNWSDFKVNGTCSTYAEPPVTAQANAAVFGIGSTIRLFANGGSAYTWTGPNNFSAVLPDPLISNAQAINSGTYTVAVPFINCTIYRSVRLNVTPLPAVQANGPTVICPSSIVKLSMSTVGTAYQWYRNDEPILRADSSVHSASQSGSYHVAVTVNGNIQVSAPIEVSVVDNLAPVPNIAQLPVLQLTAPATAPKPTASDNCSGTVLATSVNPITFTQAGTYTITWTYNDGNGNIATQTQQVVVERNDITPPVLNNLPANITVNCNTVPTAPVVTAIDDVDGVVPVTLSESSTRNPNVNSPDHYSYVITRTWSAVDGNNNTVTATRTITVVDNQAPVFGTINNIDVPTAPNMAGANVSYSVNAVDGCNSPVAYTYSILSGSFFAIGTATVKVTAADVTGNRSTVSFTVRVFDNQAPSITAPANLVINTNAGVNFATNVTLELPTVSDNLGSGVTITNNALTQYPLGETIVTWTATDAAGNSSTAIQKVTVKDAEAPVLTVPATVTTVTNNNQAFATNVDLGTATAMDNSGSAFVTNNAPGQYLIGQTTVIWTAKDAAGNTTTATQLVIVEDKQAPALVVPSGLTVSTNPGVNFATGVNLGNASGSDNSGLAVTITNNRPSVYNLGINTITWIAKDAAGNITTGIQTVTVVDREEPTIAGITNIVVDAPIGSNTAIVSSLGNPTATDNVQLVSFTNNATGNVYPIGTTAVEWIAKDAAGNQSTSIQLVIVRDATPPVLNGVPANANVSCSNIPTAATVTASDNFDQNVVVAFTQSSTKGTNPTQSSFYNYVITRTWTAKDAANNQVSATQTITVTDTEAPTLAQPVNIATNSRAGTCGATINYTVTATDNCGSPITYTFSKASETVFSVGVTTVTVTAADASGNSVSRSFTVTVTDNQAPVITAPANINVTVGTAINLGTATASDNCGVPVVTNNAPSTFPVGTTVVTWTATDAAGNTTTANQTVTVLALTNCSSSITVIPENNTFTGGIPNNIYLGYGPQRVTLRANATGGTSYTYTWSVVSGNASLNSTTSSQPVFAPAQAGTYTFEVRVRTQEGCVSVSRVTICVKDIRVKDEDNDDDCDHSSHSNKDCKHKDHKYHADCDHKSHSSKDCKNKSNKYGYDDDCNHSSHTSKDCKHKDHKYHADCDHKSHSSKDCKNKPYKYDHDDDDDCDHKSHSSKDCKHKDHKYHADCDHKSHSSKDCKNKSNKYGHYDHDDEDDGSQKVYLCHVPPGNPNNPQTLRISINAVESHLRNHPGDKLGSCDQQGCTETIPTTTKSSISIASVITETASSPVVKKLVPQITSESDLKIKVMGNPSRSFFTIQMESKHELPVQVRVFDIHGRPLESKANQWPNSTIQIGHNLGSGTYYAEFLQGTRRKLIQLIKVR